MISFRPPGGGLFSASVPKTQDPVDRAAIQDEADRERARQLRQRKGRGSTVMTTPLGISDDMTNTQRPTLLGG